MSRDIQSEVLKEEDIENADEMHFKITIYNGRTLGLRGDKHVKYADVTYDVEIMSMMFKNIRCHSINY